MQANTVMALLLSFAAGLSTVLGGLCVLLSRGKSQRLIAGSLAFAGGVMISLSLTDLFLEAKETFCAQMGQVPGVLMTVSLMAAGMLLAKFIDTFVPQNLGAPSADQGANAFCAPEWYRCWGWQYTICQKALPPLRRLMPTHKWGFPPHLPVAMHNIPEGISIALPIYYATKNRRRAIGMTVLSGLPNRWGPCLPCCFYAPLSPLKCWR